MRLVLSSTTDEITRKVVSAFSAKLNRVLHIAVPAIRQRLGTMCDDLISRSETTQSLLNGDLLGELGIPDVNQRLDAVLARIRDSILVDVVPISNHGTYLSGGLAMKILKSDYQDILGLSSAKYVSAPSGQTIPWLDWLTVGGNQILVFNFQVTTDLGPAQRGRSRTSRALMIPGSGWRVPPEFSGTGEANWLTRAFDVGELAARIETIADYEINRRL